MLDIKTFKKEFKNTIGTESREGIVEVTSTKETVKAIKTDFIAGFVTIKLPDGSRLIDLAYRSNVIIYN